MRVGRSVSFPSSNRICGCFALRKSNLPGYSGFLQFLRNFHQYNACEQAELIVRAALDPPIARQARKGVENYLCKISARWHRTQEREQSDHRGIKPTEKRINRLTASPCYTGTPHVRFSPEVPETMPQTSPWNKGKSVGQKAPFSPRDVQTIKQILTNAGNLRDLALFSMGIDTMLRGADLLTLNVDSHRPFRTVVEECTVGQQKTGKSTVVALLPYSREVLTRWIAVSDKLPWHYLFTSGAHPPGSPAEHHPVPPLGQTLGGLCPARSTEVQHPLVCGGRRPPSSITIRIMSRSSASCSGGPGGGDLAYLGIVNVRRWTLRESSRYDRHSRDGVSAYPIQSQRQRARGTLHADP